MKPRIEVSGTLYSYTTFWDTGVWDVGFWDVAQGGFLPPIEVSTTNISIETTTQNIAIEVDA